MNQVVVAWYPSMATSTFTRYPNVALSMLRLHDATPSDPVIAEQLDVVVLKCQLEFIVRPTSVEA